MGNAKKYTSEALAALHETAEGLRRVGLIDDERMREYDRGCIESEEPVQLHSVRKQDSARDYSPSHA